MKNIKLSGGLELNLTPEQEKELREYLGQESKAWKPELEEFYYFVNHNGICNLSTWVGGPMDAFKLSIGNIFKTEEEAEQALKTGWVVKLQARKRLDDYIAEKGYDADVDWSNDSIKYGFYYNFHRKEVVPDDVGSFKDNDLPYLVNEEDAQDVIANCGDDLKILLGVEK